MLNVGGGVRCKEIRRLQIFFFFLRQQNASGVGREDEKGQFLFLLESHPVCALEDRLAQGRSDRRPWEPNWRDNCLILHFLSSRDAARKPEKAQETRTDPEWSGARVSRQHVPASHLHRGAGPTRLVCPGSGVPHGRVGSLQDHGDPGLASPETETAESPQSHSSKLRSGPPATGGVSC